MRRTTNPAAPRRDEETRRIHAAKVDAERRYVDARQTAIATHGLLR